MSDDNSKIIIDEDWKTRVQREKEEAANAPEEPEAEAAEAPEAASFSGLVSGLTMQGMMALGVMAPRDAKEVMVDLDQAKYIIDTLMILREKTKGNLTPEEQGLLTQTLSELQQGFVVRSQQLQEAALRRAGINPSIQP